jgi:hypothetical protein
VDNLKGKGRESEGLEEVGSIVVNLELVVGVRKVKSRDLGDVLVLSLSLLLLKLEGDTSDGTLLDSLHEVGGVASDLVSESLGGDNSDLISKSLVGLEVEGELGVVSLNHDLGGPLDSLSSNSTLGLVTAWKSPRNPSHLVVADRFTCRLSVVIVPVTLPPFHTHHFVLFVTGEKYTEK